MRHSQIRLPPGCGAGITREVMDKTYNSFANRWLAGNFLPLRPCQCNKQAIYFDRQEGKYEYHDSGLRAKARTAT